MYLQKWVVLRDATDSSFLFLICILSISLSYGHREDRKFIRLVLMMMICTDFEGMDFMISPILKCEADIL